VKGRYKFKRGTSRKQFKVLNFHEMRFQILIAITMKTVVFRDVTSWCPSTMIKAAGHAETSVYSTRLHSITSQKVTLFKKLYMWQHQNVPRITLILSNTKQYNHLGYISFKVVALCNYGL